jgi:hypothetical protein
LTDFDDFRLRDAKRFVADLEDSIARTPIGAPVPGMESIEGEDASGTVYCAVRADGHPLRVAIMDGWWEAVGPHAIGGAVLQAYRYAREKAMIGRLVLQDHGRPWQRPPRPARPTPGAEAPVHYATVAHEIDALSRQLNQAAVDLQAAVRLAERTSDQQPREVSGPRGLFTLTMQGATIESARVNQFGLRPDHAAELARDALEALIAARPDHGNPKER